MEDNTWIALDRHTGSKIVSMKQLNDSLEQISSDREMNVARVYASLNEWFNAKELRNYTNLRKNRNFLISSWLVIESDYPLLTSIHFYRHLYHQLYDLNLEPKLLFTGNRSIHFYIPFTLHKYLNPQQQHIRNTSQTFNLQRELWLEKVARRNFFAHYLDAQERFSTYMDKRLKYDLLRQVPVAYTFNLETKKFVTPISRNYLFCNPSEIVRKSTIPPWLFEQHQALDQKIQKLVEEQEEDLKRETSAAFSIL